MRIEYKKEKKMLPISAIESGGLYFHDGSVWMRTYHGVTKIFGSVNLISGDSVILSEQGEKQLVSRANFKLVEF